MKKILVHLHLYYFNQLDYYLEKLKNIVDCDWDLYVTLCIKDKNVEQKLKEFKPESKILICENRGYDIEPFLNVLNQVDLENYDSVIKLHTKKNRLVEYCNEIYLSNFELRDNLVNSLLQNKKQFRKNLNFLNSKKYGMICGSEILLPVQKFCTKDVATNLKVLEDKLNIKTHYSNFLDGSMFWINTEILKRLKSLDIYEFSTSDSFYNALKAIFAELTIDTGYKIYARKNILKDLFSKIFFIKKIIRNNKPYKLIKILGATITIGEYKNIDKESSQDEINKHLKTLPKRVANTVCYTCITGNYDNLIQHKYIDKNWDYICITDNKDLINKKHVGIWEIRPLVYDKEDNSYNNRWHKFFPHKFLKNYSNSVYVDGNINLLSPYLSKELKKLKQPLVLPKHFSSEDLYEELDFIVRAKKDTEENIKTIRDFYQKEEFPTGLGFAENNIIYRQHDNEKIQLVMEDWWNMIHQYSRRDQASLSYVMWKNELRIGDYTLVKNARFDTSDFGATIHAKENK